jgi:hypothetical protein
MARPVIWSWPRAFLVAVLAIWAPSLPPLALGAVAGHAHCVRTYLQCLPLLPGVFPSLALGAQEAWFFAIAAAASAALVLFVAWLLRTSYYKAFVAVVVAVAAGAHALVFAELLRR